MEGVMFLIAFIYLFMYLFIYLFFCFLLVGCFLFSVFVFMSLNALA